MAITAVLVWYDEPAWLLRENVESWGRLADTLVAVDGAFDGFPGGGARSPVEQAQAITAGARAAGMGCLTHHPAGLWRDHPEKRTFAARLAETLTEPHDWYFNVDADEELVHAVAADALDRTTLDVAEIIAEQDGRPVAQPRLMRAVRGLTVQGLHYRYGTPDGRFFWNYPGEPQEPRLTFDARLRHRREERGQERLARAKAYYRQRTEKFPS